MRVDIEDHGTKKDTWRLEGISFRDKVLGRDVGSFPKFTEDMLMDKVKLSFENGNSMRPMVFFEEFLMAAMSLPWKDALVVKVLRLFLSFIAIKEKLRVL